jgi:hypothetical protein
MKQFLFLWLVAMPLLAVAGPHITSVVPITAGKIGRYEKFEVSLSLDRSFATRAPGRNPFDPADVSVSALFIGPDGRTNALRYGFYYQDFTLQTQYLATNNARYWQPRPTPQPWRVRFAPDTVGTWHYVLTVRYSDGTTETSLPRLFECVPSANPGFLRVAPNRRNLVFDRGQSFLAIGSNVDYWSDNAIRLPVGVVNPGPSRTATCNGTSILEPRPSEQRRFSTYTYYAYQQAFQDLASVGGNFARVWLHEYNWDLETYDAATGVNTLGYYQPHQNRMYDLDRVVLAARATGVYLHMSLLDGQRLWNNEQLRTWLTFPYAVGLEFGPTEQLRFFTDSEARRLFRNKIRYVVARWGYSPNIASYELLNEGDFTNAGQLFEQNYGNDLPPLLNWTVAMATYLKRLDARHLHTVAYAPDHSYELLSRHPTLFDYSTSHDYTASFNAELRRNYATQVMTRLLQRPYQLQEVDYLPYINTLYQAKFHTMPWATAFSGAMGTGLALSAFANLHHPCYPAYQHYKPLARFLAATHFASSEPNEPVGNVAGAARALYGPNYFMRLNRADTVPLFTTAPAAASPDYFSACDLQCPPGWHQSVGIAPYFASPLDKDSLNQNDRTDYLVDNITTTNDGLLEVFGLRNPGRVVGWIHNKTHYWYNLPHTVQSGQFCRGDSCARNPNVSSNLNKGTSNTIRPLKGQWLWVHTGDPSDTLRPTTYRVRWFYTYPGRDVDRDGDPDNGGFVAALEQPAVPVIKGHLQLCVPSLVALGNANGPLAAPDYAFCLTRNPPAASQQPAPQLRPGAQTPQRASAKPVFGRPLRPTSTTLPARK